MIPDPDTGVDIGQTLTLIDSPLDGERRWLHMPMVSTPGCTLYAESFGMVGDPALLLISGLGSQVTSWPIGFCEAFVDRGFFVIRFDNRDVGLSTIFPADSQYTLSDMADDCVAILGHFDVDAAHVMGSSLGGMIAQTLTIDHPEVVLSLTSYISRTGNPEFHRMTEEARDALLLWDPTSREEAVEFGLVGKRIWGTEGAWSIEEYSAFLGDNFDRSPPRDGSARQHLALERSGNRDELLANVSTPTLVIHGGADPLIHPMGGRRTADVIPNASYVEIEGMGHDLPITEWPQIVSLVTSHAAQAVNR
jgi:pimeloyl-ACP methyl ester carboxylesterase